MKNFKNVSLAILGLVGFAATSNAQSTATATATAEVITPITIANTANMSFGNIAVKATTGGTVILAADGSRTKSGDVTLPATAGTVTAAEFDVDGTAAYTYAVTLPGTVALNHSAGAGTGTMSAGSFVTNLTSNAGLLNGSGEQTFKVGATLTVAAAQAPGVYTSTAFNVTVNYN